MKKKESAGIIILRKENSTYKVLLLNSYNFWDFPKGGIEKGENKLEAAIREVKEETGIKDLNFNWGKTYYSTDPFGKNKKVVFYFVAETDETEVIMGISPLLGKPEHEEYKWVTLEEANNLIVNRIKNALDWAIDRVKVFEKNDNF